MIKRSKIQNDVVSYLYLIGNLLSGKTYVGISRNPKKRWKYHKFIADSPNNANKHAIHFAIKKYGIDNFSFKIIEKFNKWSDACDAEIKWINEFKINNFKLYNEKNGGQGGFTGVQLFGSDNGNYGKKMKPYLKKILLNIRRKLTDEQVLEIRKLYADKKYTQMELSKRYNISASQIFKIVHNKSFSNNPNRIPITKKRMSKDTVLKLRELFSIGKYTIEELSKKFNYSIIHINDIIKYKVWKNIK